MRILKLTTLIAIIFLKACSIEAQEATKWRGPTGEGIYDGSGLLDEWPAGGPEILWSFEGLGQGHSSPVIYKDHIYTSGMIKGKGHLFKFTMDGTLVYSSEYGPEFTESWYGTRGSPTVAGKKIFLLSGYGKLLCLNESDGSLIWEKDLVKEFGGSVITWGYCETPLVDGDVVYATPGGKKYNVVALNQHDGSLIWRCGGKGELSAYCSPRLLTHNGRKILVTHTESHLLGIDAKTGELLFSHYHPNQYSVHPNTPIYQDGGLFFFSGYGKGGGKLLLNDDASKAKLAWKTPLDSRMGGAVLIDGYIYGSGDNNRAWRCIDWETGEDAWTSEELGKGVTIAAGDKLIAYSDRGEIGLINITPEKFDLVGKARVTLGSEQHWAHPVVHEGVLYLRHGKALIAYKIK